MPSFIGCDGRCRPKNSVLGVPKREAKCVFLRVDMFLNDVDLSISEPSTDHLKSSE